MIISRDLPPLHFHWNYKLNKKQYIVTYVTIQLTAVMFFIFSTRKRGVTPSLF
jgi:hypothetical protein